MTYYDAAEREPNLDGERRDMQRQAPMSFLEGDFQLQVEEGRTLEVIRLRDVSPFGLGVDVHQGLAPGALAQMVYQKGDEIFTVRGTVLWARTVEAGVSPDAPFLHYQLGLKLEPGDVAANLRFFRSVTQS